MRRSARHAALLGGVLLAWALGGPACAEDPATPAAAEAGPTAPAGTYLAARAADRAGDFPTAAALYAQALAADPGDPQLLDGALFANLALGRLDEAVAAATRAEAQGSRSPLANMAIQLGHAVDGDWRGLLGDLEAGRTVGPLADGLSRAWAWMGLDRADAALSALDELATAEPYRPFALYHKALTLAFSGDLEAAEALFSQPSEGGIQRTRRAVLAHAAVLAALGRMEEARRLIDDPAQGGPDASLLALRERLRDDAPQPFDLVASPAAGLSEAYLNLVAAVGEEDPRTGLLYARAALLLDPGNAEAALLAAGRLEALGQPDLAREVYALVSPEDPVFVEAELGRAAALRAEGEETAALEVLRALAADHPDRSDVQATLGDLFRTLRRFEEAEAAYTRAIDLSGQGDRDLWWTYFARAMSREAQGDWPAAEADLRRSLVLHPDSPQVLNHLGYGLVERGESLAEALDMIARAVELRPDSGAIVDSLGWAYFKLGRYSEAVAELERAAALLPSDPVINDHLGDAYWTVGRLREARFQWARALSLDPEPELAARIRQKLETGLEPAPSRPEEDAAMTQEGLQGG